MKVKITKNGKETTFERTFRHLVNARKFIKELTEDEDVKCTPLNSAGDTFTKECKGEKVSYFFEIKRIRIVKPKKETGKKEEAKQQQQEKSAPSPTQPTQS